MTLRLAGAVTLPASAVLGCVADGPPFAEYAPVPPDAARGIAPNLGWQP